MKKVLYYFFVISYLLVFFVMPNLAFGADKNYGMEKIFYLPKYNAVKGVDSLSQNWQKIDILAPQYHVVNYDFTVSGSFGPKLKTLIKEHNLKVMPLIANANFSRTIIHNLLISEPKQDKVVNYLVKGALTNGYVGWQFDFENIDCNDRDLFTAFVQRASKVFKKNNLVLSVATIARSVDYEDTKAFKNWGGVYDYKKIADSADFISLMAYDDPESKGPVSSLEYVNKILVYMKDKIPAEKMSLGVPLYYWKWNTDTNTKIGSGLYKNVLTIMQNFAYNIAFNKDLGVACLTYSYNNKNYAVWYEDKTSLQMKLDIIKDNKLRGFSAWLLGGEDPDIWKII